MNAGIQIPYSNSHVVQSTRHAWSLAPSIHGSTVCWYADLDVLVKRLDNAKDRLRVGRAGSEVTKAAANYRSMIRRLQAHLATADVDLEKGRRYLTIGRKHTIRYLAVGRGQHQHVAERETPSGRLTVALGYWPEAHQAVLGLFIQRLRVTEIGQWDKLLGEFLATRPTNIAT